MGTEKDSRLVEWCFWKSWSAIFICERKLAVPGNIQLDYGCNGRHLIYIRFISTHEVGLTLIRWYPFSCIFFPAYAFMLQTESGPLYQSSVLAVPIQTSYRVKHSASLCENNCRGLSLKVDSIQVQIVA